MIRLLKSSSLRIVAIALMAGVLAPTVIFGEERGLASYVGTAKPPVFDTPEAAVEQLKSALSSADPGALANLLGLDATKVRSSEDAVTTYHVIQEGVARRVVLEDWEGGKFVAIGDRLWPLPFPLSKDNDGKWSFNTQKGLNEILNRRVGRNELQTIDMMHAYLDAQIQYAGEDRDGDGVLEYAQKLVSSDGRTDGLYWPPAEDVGPSPAGDFIIDAALKRAGKGAGYFGYRYRILTSQGSEVVGGAYDYVINGNMIAGFGLIAWPVEYGQSGVKSFMVNQQGIVYERDLGADTSKLASQIKQFNPDRFWSPVAD